MDCVVGIQPPNAPTPDSAAASEWTSAAKLPSTVPAAPNHELPAAPSVESAFALTVVALTAMLFHHLEAEPAHH